MEGRVVGGSGASDRRGVPNGNDLAVVAAASNVDNGGGGGGGGGDVGAAEAKRNRGRQAVRRAGVAVPGWLVAEAAATWALSDATPALGVNRPENQEVTTAITLNSSTQNGGARNFNRLERYD